MQQHWQNITMTFNQKPRLELHMLAYDWACYQTHTLPWQHNDTKKKGKRRFEQMLFPRLSHTGQAEYCACAWRIKPVMKKAVAKGPPKKTICKTIVIMKLYHTGKQREALSYSLLHSYWQRHERLWMLCGLWVEHWWPVKRKQGLMTIAWLKIYILKINFNRITAGSFSFHLDCSTEDSLFRFLPFKMTAEESPRCIFYDSQLCEDTHTLCVCLPLCDLHTHFFWETHFRIPVKNSVGLQIHQRPFQCILLRCCLSILNGGNSLRYEYLTLTQLRGAHQPKVNDSPRHP